VQKAYSQAAYAVLKQLHGMGALNIYTGAASASVVRPCLRVHSPGALPTSVHVNSP
jgi:hypothetical protein